MKVFYQMPQFGENELAARQLTRLEAAGHAKNNGPTVDHSSRRPGKDRGGADFFKAQLGK